MTAFRDRFLQCPRCRGTLEAAGSAWGCRPCRGAWLEEPILDEMMRTMHAQPTSPAVFPRAAPGGLACPQCTVPLDAVVLEDVPVDRCSNQHGIWFDAGELETALRNAAPVRDPATLIGSGSPLLDLLSRLLDRLS